MQTVTLGGDISTTRLGFGTAGVLREPSKRRRLSILAAALDAGIRHFDTAPIYGFGEAERLLGEFLARRHERVTIATKFGLTARAAATRLAPVQSVARAVLKAVPALRNIVRRGGNRFHEAPCFDAATAQASLERSLAALRVERVDVLLLHECTPAAVRDPALLTWLQREVDRGLIGTFGTATGFGHTLAMLASHSAYCRLVQFDSDALTQNVLQLPRSLCAALITHSVLTHSRAAIVQALRADAGLCARWQTALDANVADTAVLSRLLLQAAIDANPRGVVLVHSNSVQHIAANAAAAAGPGNPQQLALLVELLRARFNLPTVAVHA